VSQDGQQQNGKSQEHQRFHGKFPFVQRLWREASANFGFRPALTGRLYL
jgi:hypothetical protein